MSSPVISALNWRYATKKFDVNKRVSSEMLEVLLESVRLSPSSFGLQPWKVFIIANPAIREKLKAAAWNQPQITEASHLLIFAYKNAMDKEYIESYIADIASTRGQDPKELEGMKQMLVGSVKGRDKESIKVWNSRQIYIALGVLLISAALLKIDACPMEGFDNAQFDKILGLNNKGYSSVVIAAIGYRSDTDEYAKSKKVRFNKEEVFEKI